MKSEILKLLSITLLTVCMTACGGTDTAGDAAATASEVLHTEAFSAEEYISPAATKEPETSKPEGELTPEQIKQEAIKQAKAYFSAKQYDEVKAQPIGEEQFNGWVRMYNLYLSDNEVCNYNWKVGVTIGDICSQGLYAYSDTEYTDENGKSIDTYKVNSYEPAESCIVYFKEMATDETKGYVLAANLTDSVCDIEALTIVGISSNYSAIAANMDGKSQGKVRAQHYFESHYDSITEYTCTAVSEDEYKNGRIFHFFDMGDGAWWIVQERADGWIGGEGTYLMADYAEDVIEMWSKVNDTANVNEYFFDTLLKQQ